MHRGKTRELRYNSYMKLNCTTRTVLGKKVKKLREFGQIPAELFGAHTENKHLTLNAKDFLKIYKNAGTHGIVELIIDEKSPINALITDVTEGPYSKIPLSVGFHAIELNEKIHAFVPVLFEGESPMAKNGFPILKLVDELEIEALPKNVPESIKVSLDLLTEESSKIHIKELSVSKNVKILHADPEQVVVTVGGKTKEEPQKIAEQPKEGVETSTPQDGVQL